MPFHPDNIMSETGGYYGKTLLGLHMGYRIIVVRLRGTAYMGIIIIVILVANNFLQDNSHFLLFNPIVYGFKIGFCIYLENIDAKTSLMASIAC
jgi:hypothetical protein